MRGWMRAGIALGAVISSTACSPKLQPPAAEWLAHWGERVLVADVPETESDGGCGCRGSRLAIDQHGRRVLYVADKSKLWQIAAAGGSPERLTKPDKGLHDGDPTVERELVAWLRSRPGDTYRDEVDVVLRRPVEGKGFADLVLTATGGDKVDLHFVPGGRLLTWHGRTRKLDSYHEDRAYLADLLAGVVRPLGPTSSGVEVIVAPSGHYVATRSSSDEGCRMCALLGGGFGIVRIFETASGKEVVSLEGAVQSHAFAGAGDELLMVAGSGLFFRDGEPLDARGGGAAGLYRYDLATGQLSLKSSLPNQGDITPMEGALMVYRPSNQRLEQWTLDGKKELSFEDVEAWTPSADGTAYARIQLRDDGKRALIVRSVVCK